jgi:hypothetical protein
VFEWVYGLGTTLTGSMLLMIFSIIISPVRVGVSSAGFFNDLHAYDPTSMAWTDLSAAVSGAPPAPRYGHGFAAAGGLLYSFGGRGADNGVC